MLNTFFTSIPGILMCIVSYFTTFIFWNPWLIFTEILIFHLFLCFLLSYCHVWCFVSTQRIPFNICAGLVWWSWTLLVLVCLKSSLSLLLCWMMALLNRVYLAADVSIFALWVCYGTLFSLGKFLLKNPNHLVWLLYVIVCNSIILLYIPCM